MSRSSVQIPTKGRFCRLASFYFHWKPIFEKARKTEKKREKPRKPSVFQVASFLDAQYGCGDGIWTSWPSGYEPDELPDCSTPRYDWCRKPGSNRYEIKSHGILSPGRLPIPPFRHIGDRLSSIVPYYYITARWKCQYFFDKNIFSPWHIPIFMISLISAVSAILYCTHRECILLLNHTTKHNGKAISPQERLSFGTPKIAKPRTSNAISNTFQNYNLIRRNISPFGEDTR